MAWVIFSVVLLGIAKFQWLSFRGSYHAFLKSLAVAQVMGMMERLRVSYSGAARSKELAIWNNENKHLLPQGEGNYVCHKKYCRVNIQWKENQHYQHFSLISAACAYMECRKTDTPYYKIGFSL